jgi:ketosteroid isomerase-like protein
MPRDPLQRLVDHQAITDLIHAYCRGVDAVDAAGVAALFTADCVVDYGPGLGEPTHGAAQLERRLAAGLPRFAATSHHVSNIEITFDDSGRTASGVTYLYAWHRYPDDRPDAELWARYHDRFVRDGDRWLISERILRVAGQQDFDVDWHPVERSA